MTLSNAKGVRILAAGVDSVYLSARGKLRDSLVDRLAAERADAELNGEPSIIELADGDGFHLLRPHSWRGYRFWLTSRNWELFVGANEPFPPVYVMLHSAYLHEVGVEVALAEIDTMLTQEIFNGACVTSVSRADIYADVQGWAPRLADVDRFVCRGVRRRAFLAAAEVHSAGRALSGFTFGRHDLMARIYDKTREMRVTEDTWPDLMWENADPERPVWRIEFQFRAKSLRNFGIATPYALLIGRQDLWDYATGWLSMRKRSKSADSFRWAEDKVWTAIKAARIGTPACGLVRERITQTDARRLTRGFIGYASALAAMTHTRDLDSAVAASLPLVRRYLEERGTTFGRIVDEKQRKQGTR